MLDCSQGVTAPVQDGAADILEVVFSLAGNGDSNVDVFLLDPLADPTQDYSFAVVLTLTLDDDTQLEFHWEWHDGSASIGPPKAADWTTLAGISGPEPGARFIVTAQMLKGHKIKKVSVQSYHMASPDSLWVCDDFTFEPGAPF